MVQLKILNFKITVLGDVKNPGTFSIPNEKITFTEALGIAGDLNITANIEEIQIFREEHPLLTSISLLLTTLNLILNN